MSVETTTINDLPIFMIQANEELVKKVQQAIASQFHIKITEIEARRFTLSMLTMATEWELDIKLGVDGSQPTSAR